MSGVKISRTENENRFKKGMYPTENDFANVFASFVHKDDTISMSQVTLGDTDETIGEVIDKKADKKNLEDFIKDVDTILKTVRNPETGEISKTVIQDFSKRIEDAENDLADTSNTAEQNESAIAKILSILGKQEGETVSELAEKFTALSGDYATVYAFVSKVKDFLESADVADTTINRWQEIESFLQGITDTDTLTGLMQEMKQEIIDQIPEPQSNYLEQVEDLDGYTDAPEGKIVQYIGQTNEKYTRGFIYEKVEALGTQLVAQEDVTVDTPWEYSMNGVAYLDLKRGIANISIVYNSSISLFTLRLSADNAINAKITHNNNAYLDVAYDTNGGTHVISINNEGAAVAEGVKLNKSQSSLLYIRKSDNKAFAVANFNNISFIIPMRTDGKFDLSKVEVATTHNGSIAKDESGKGLGTVTFTPYYERDGTTSAWQLCPSMPVIS